jgi:acetolactate synthase-1/2/3 large subunit
MDGGDITVFGATVLRVYEPGHWLDNGPLGCLGPGLPFALAAKLARPDKQVLLLSGDGSFGLNGMEMDTAIRHKLPVVVVIGNDAAWGMVKHEQEDHYGRAVGTELRLARYDKMVEALGGHGEYVERPQDIRPALERAFASGLPACVNVRVDPTAVTGRRVACRRG